MFKKFIALGVLLVMIFSVTECNGDNNGPTEEAQNGAYFAKGSGNESAVILGNLMSLFGDRGRCDVFQFSLDGDSYVGENVRAKVSIRFIGDELRVILTSVGGSANNTIKLKRNASIELSEEEPIQLAAPENTKSSIHDIDICWSFTDNMIPPGILGAGAEVKRPGTDDFIVAKIQDYYSYPDCFFYIYLRDLKLIQGVNILRISHLGGPFFYDGKIRLSLDSEPIYFNATVDSEGNVTAIEVNE